MAVLADGLDGRLRRVIPYLLFPSDPASAAMHCAPAGHAPRSVSPEGGDHRGGPCSRQRVQVLQPYFIVPGKGVASVLDLS